MQMRREGEVIGVARIFDFLQKRLGGLGMVYYCRAYPILEGKCKNFNVLTQKNLRNLDFTVQKKKKIPPPENFQVFLSYQKTDRWKMFLAKILYTPSITVFSIYWVKKKLERFLGFSKKKFLEMFFKKALTPDSEKISKNPSNCFPYFRRGTFSTHPFFPSF